MANDQFLPRPVPPPHCCHLASVTCPSSKRLRKKKSKEVIHFLVKTLLQWSRQFHMNDNLQHMHLVASLTLPSLFYSIIYALSNKHCPLISRTLSCMCAKLNYSCVWLSVQPLWTIAHQPPLSGILQERIMEWVAVPVFIQILFITSLT